MNFILACLNIEELCVKMECRLNWFYAIISFYMKKRQGIEIEYDYLSHFQNFVTSLAFILSILPKFTLQCCCKALINLIEVRGDNRRRTEKTRIKLRFVSTVFESFDNTGIYTQCRPHRTGAIKTMTSSNSVFVYWRSKALKLNEFGKNRTDAIKFSNHMDIFD